MTREEQVPVSERALVQRINRRLSKKDQVLYRAREHLSWRVGRYYVVDVSTSSLLHENIDLEDWGRKIGALKAWERLADEDGESVTL